MTFTIFESALLLGVFALGMYTSWKKGENEGSTYMLKYLRDHKFLDDTGYYKFMAHIRAEKRAQDMFNKKDKDEKDI